VVVEPRLLLRVDREPVPEDDVAVPDAGDDLLDDGLTEEPLGIRDGRDLEGIQVHERLGGILFLLAAVVSHAHGEPGDGLDKVPPLTAARPARVARRRRRRMAKERGCLIAAIGAVLLVVRLVVFTPGLVLGLWDLV